MEIEIVCSGERGLKGVSLDELGLFLCVPLATGLGDFSLS
jgi:hypothetical protein